MAKRTTTRTNTGVARASKTNGMAYKKTRTSTKPSSEVGGKAITDAGRTSSHGRVEIAGGDRSTSFGSGSFSKDGTAAYQRANRASYGDNNLGIGNRAIRDAGRSSSHGRVEIKGGDRYTSFGSGSFSKDGTKAYQRANRSSYGDSDLGVGTRAIKDAGRSSTRNKTASASRPSVSSVKTTGAAKNTSTARSRVQDAGRTPVKTTRKNTK